MIFVDIVPEALLAEQAKPTESDWRTERRKSLEVIALKSADGIAETKPKEVFPQTKQEDTRIFPEPSGRTRVFENWGSLTTSLVMKPSCIDEVGLDSLRAEAMMIAASIDEEDNPSHHSEESANSRVPSMNKRAPSVKYVMTEDGIRQLNPQWEADQRENGTVTVYPFANRSTALPVVSYHSQESLFDDLSSDESDVDSALSDQQEEIFRRSAGRRHIIQPTAEYEEALEQYESHWKTHELQEDRKLETFNEYDEIAAMTSEEFVVVDSEETHTSGQCPNGTERSPENGYRGWDGRLMRQLQGVLARYEIPGGMLTKLLALENFEVAEIIVDDSNHMNELSDVEDPNSPREAAVTHFFTRWEETRYRLEQMMELVAFLPDAPVFSIRFLNRPRVMEFKRNRRESPYSFVDRVKDSLGQEFVHEPKPKDASPAYERIRESFLRHGRAATNGVLRYFMTCGVPGSDGKSSHKISHLLQYRKNPERNPFTFLVSTDDGEYKGWIRECAKAAPFCLKFEDYQLESQAILRDQGKAFPYSYGLYLVGQLVAVFHPEDLGAMDVGVPFTQPTLSNLLGYQMTRVEYQYYFENFCDAQYRSWASMEDYQREFVGKLSDLFESFFKAAISWDIVEVRNYRRRHKAGPSSVPIHDQQPGQLQSSPSSPGKTMIGGARMQGQGRVARLMKHNSLPKLLRENSISRLLGSPRKKKDTFQSMNDSINLEQPKSPKKSLMQRFNDSFNREGRRSPMKAKEKFRNRRLSA